MIIAHISDLHMRALKYHPDYRKVFSDFYEKLREIKPDLIINTGDSVHSKTNISPELVDLCREHFCLASDNADYHLILGNHDLNLMNPDRQDAVSPIVNAIGRDNIFLHKNSGRVRLKQRVAGRDVNLWVFGIGDHENYPTKKDWEQYPDDINIGLFHGAISKCVTDSNWRMTHTEHDVSIFDGLDYTLMGDIHKQQFMDDDRRIGYAGSLVQQNFGEDVNKGFLVWNIEDKDRHTVYPVYLSGSSKFYTITLNADLSLPDTVVEPQSHVRVIPPREISLVEQKDIERRSRKKFLPKDLVVLSPICSAGSTTVVAKNDVQIENLRQSAVQQKLLKDWLERHSVDKDTVELVLALDRKYQVTFEEGDETARDVTWSLNKIAWSNMFNYGEDNYVDFSKLHGLTGIFAENSRGKSSFIDIITETLFDKVTKPITKNLSLVNDNKEIGSMVADISTDKGEFGIERKVERLKYGARKFKEEKEWGKTSCDFYSVDDDGEPESLNGDIRPATEKNIRQRIGNFEDFMLTSLISQDNTLDMIKCKETDRKKILFRFLDLDIFGEKLKFASDESKTWYDKLSALEDSGIQENIDVYRIRSSDLAKEIAENRSSLDDVRKKLIDVGQTILDLTTKKVKIDNTTQKPEDIKRKLSLCVDVIDGFTKKLLEKKKKLKENTTEIASIDASGDIDELKIASSRYLIVQAEIRTLEGTCSKLEQRLLSNRNRLPLLDEVPCGDSYPSCKFLVDAFQSKALLPRWEDELTEVKTALAELRNEHDKLLPLSQQYTSAVKNESHLAYLNSDSRGISLEIENIELKLSEARKKKLTLEQELSTFEKSKDDVIRNAKLDEEIEIFVSKKVHLEKLSLQIQERLDLLNREHGGQELVLKKLESEMQTFKDVKERCTAFEHYCQAMGKDGIAYDILAQQIPLINEEINKILSFATDFTVGLEHDIEEQSIVLYLQYGDYRPRMLELGGGAEKMMASIAIRVALLSISSLPKPNMFLIDEGFGKLDPKNMEAVGMMFDYLKSVFQHVIVISHVDIMKDMVDNVIEITTDNEGYSHIVV